MLFVLLPQQRCRLVGISCYRSLRPAAAILTVWFGVQPHTASIGAKGGDQEASLILSPNKIVIHATIYYYLYFIFCGIFLLPLTISVVQDWGWRSFQFLVLESSLSSWSPLPRLCVASGIFAYPCRSVLHFVPESGVPGFMASETPTADVARGDCQRSESFLGAMGTTYFAFTADPLVSRRLAQPGTTPFSPPSGRLRDVVRLSGTDPSHDPTWVMRGGLFDRYLPGFLARTADLFGINSE